MAGFSYQDTWVVRVIGTRLEEAGINVMTVAVAFLQPIISIRAPPVLLNALTKVGACNKR